MHELLSLERWLISLRAESLREGMGARRDRAVASEINDRCRVLHLVRRGISACAVDRVDRGLRGFLSQLGADEAGRVHAICERDGALQSAGMGRA